MNVLILLNSCYPYSGTGTNIINKLLFDGELLSFFESIDVLCEKETVTDKSYDCYHSIKVTRTSSYTLLPRKDLNTLRTKSLKEFLCACIEKAIYHFEDVLFSNAFSDRFAEKSFYDSLEHLNNHYDVIISMSGRYYQSIAAAKYCNKNRIPFIFYQVDPCASNQYLPKKSLKLRERIEKSLYESASCVITTDLIFNDIKKYLPEYLCKKVRVLEFPLIVDKTVERNGNNPPICVFTGSIYAGIRDPKYTMRLFEHLVQSHNVELHFAGMNKDDLPDIGKVICHGVLPIDEATELNEKADFLINIGNSVTNQVPSKLFDYISTGKPIINICKNRNCPTIKYLKNYPYALTIYEEEDLFEEQEKLLSEFVVKNKGKRAVFNEIKSIYKECTPEYCVKEIKDMLESAVQR